MWDNLMKADISKSTPYNYQKSIIEIVTCQH